MKSYPILDEAKKLRFQELLLSWYEKHQRTLPWRSDPSPYKVWLSEILLQQTQVRTVLPFFTRILRRFPDIATLAAASEDQVLALWAGLGYYSRARNLHRTAQIIDRNFQGQFPQTEEELLLLPGIGRYTAGAILSIAFHQPLPIVDGNIRRVIRRLLGMDSATPERFYWHQAKEWLPHRRVAEFNQAVMELGALVCTPASPRCPICPVRSLCQAYSAGERPTLPKPGTKAAVENISLCVLVIRRRNRVAMVKTHKPQFIPGEWGLPAKVLTDGEEPRRVARMLARRIVSGLENLRINPNPAPAEENGKANSAGRTLSPLVECPPVQHAITYRRIRAWVFCSKLQGSGLDKTKMPNLRWASPSEAGHFLVSSLFKKAINSAIQAQSRR